MSDDVTVKSVQRLVITVRPSPSDDGLLTVQDAMEQVLDFLRVADNAKSWLEREKEDFVWRLQSASANSPFTVVAVAEALEAGADISDYVGAVKKATHDALEKCSEGIPAPAWVTSQTVGALYSLFSRNANGVASTLVDFEGDVGSIQIDDDAVENALPVLVTPELFDEENIPARIAFGEIDGRLVSVGRYQRRPAIQLVTSLYGTVWGVLPDHLVEEYGGEQTIGDVWKGKRLVLFGKMRFPKGGKSPYRIDVESIHPKKTPKVDIESVLDPDFTSGLDPVEYLERLHGGELG
jgi:hypothetical protein